MLIFFKPLAFEFFFLYPPLSVEFLPIPILKKSSIGFCKTTDFRKLYFSFSSVEPNDIFLSTLPLHFFFLPRTKNTLPCFPLFPARTFYLWIRRDISARNRILLHRLRELSCSSAHLQSRGGGGCCSFVSLFSRGLNRCGCHLHDNRYTFRKTRMDILSVSEFPPRKCSILLSAWRTIVEERLPGENCGKLNKNLLLVAPGNSSRNNVRKHFVLFSFVGKRNSNLFARIPICIIEFARRLF